MPLASNVASMKAGLVPKPSDSHPKKTAFGTNHTNTNHRRDSIGSTSSRTHNNNSTEGHLHVTVSKNNNRLSLPKSLPSSTIVTKSKVDRRRSIRRSIAKENESSKITDAATTTIETPNKKRKCHDDDAAATADPDAYSPPETRSASQKKQKQRSINPDFFHNHSNALLQFSPPDQRLNAQREHDRIQQKEAERARRIAEARRNGQLLLYSATNDETNELKPSPVTTQEEFVSKEETKETKNDEDLIKKMSDEVSRLAQYQMEAKNERRNSDAQLLQKVQEMITKEKEMASSSQSLSVLQSTTKVLEQSNAKLLEEMKQLNAKLVTETEAHTIQTTQLEMKLQRAHEQVLSLEQFKSELEHQITTLESENSSTTTSLIQLKQELKDAYFKLDSTQKEMEDLKSAMSHENMDSIAKINQLQQAINELHGQVDEESKSRSEALNALQATEDEIQRLNSEVIPNLQATIEIERDAVARFEQALELRQQEMDHANDNVQRLQKEIQILQDQHQELQRNSEVAEQDHQRMVDEFVKVRTEMEEKLNETNKELKMENDHLIEKNDVLQLSNDSFVTQQKQLNDALEEAMVQLDHTENEKRAVELKLKQAVQQMDAMQKSLSLTNSETSEMIQQLSEQVNTERQFREEAEQMRNGLDSLVRSQKQEITTLQQQMQLTVQERDVARNNMDGFNVREQKLYEQLQHYEHIRREMHSKLIQLMGNIRVFIRIRPRLSNEAKKENGSEPSLAAKKHRPSIVDGKRKEAADNDDDDIFRFPGVYESSDRSVTVNDATASHTDATKNMIEVTAPYKYRGGLSDRRQQWTFGFDRVFTPTHTQSDIWEATDPLIQCAVDGYNVTIFAYGQTGSGKTFTMLGEEGINEGIIGRTVRKLFDEKQKIIDLSRGKSNIHMFVELLEIYNEKVRDLLTSGKDELKLTSNEVVGNILVETNSVDEVLQVLKLAQGRRCVKATNSNSESSRSHMIFTIHFKVTMNDGVTIRNGKVNICDLAGSERLDKSGANTVGGALLEETKNINKSLSVLSNVIEKLQAGDNKNVPFRESKLTYLLKDSLSGNSKTLAIICCNPLASHMNESLCSLRFAEKVNRVDLKAVANFTC